MTHAICTHPSNAPMILTFGYDTINLKHSQYAHILVTNPSSLSLCLCVSVVVVVCVCLTVCVFVSVSVCITTDPT